MKRFLKHHRDSLPVPDCSAPNSMPTLAHEHISGPQPVLAGKKP